MHTRHIVRFLAALAALACTLIVAEARAQVEVSVSLPTVRFELPPPLVVVQPGIQVVAELPDEVFVVDGRYWCRHGGRWYRARDHRGDWILVTKGVPPGLRKLKPGKYKHFHAPPPKVKVVKEERGKHHGPGKAGGKGKR